MNYPKQMNAFYKLLSSNPLSANAQCLYNYLVYKNNELAWAEEFTISNMIVCGFTSLSRQALDRARNELVQKGYIKYKKGVSNQAGKYSIVCFVTQNDTQDNTHGNTQDDTQSGHILSTLNNNNIIIYLNLIEKTRARYPLPRNSVEILAAQAYARSLDEWQLLTKDEQFRVIGLI